MQIVQPYDRVPIVHVDVDDATSVHRKLASADQVFKDRSDRLPASERIEILRRLALLVQRDSDQFALLIAREGGKPLTDARVEVMRAINGIEGAASEIERLAGREIPMGLTAASRDRWAFTTTEPIGIVVAISAFNHPLNLIVHQAIPAVATGCPVIVKPAPTTPLSCLSLVKLLYEAGLPEPWCQAVVTEDNALAEGLATDPRVAFVSFIGSAKVGWYLRSRLAPGTRLALEHGGAAPVIVDKSADIDRVIEPLVRGGYYHAGQVCVSTQRIFVHEKIKDNFCVRFGDRVKKLEVGDPTFAETEVGPLILPREVNRIETWVDEALSGKGELLVGGTRIGETVYKPTVILEPDITARVSQEEIFGPVTCIYGYTDLNDAICRANGLPFAFQAAVFTAELEVALTAARLLDASAVMINDHTAFRADWMPFSGRRQSGYGIGGIPYTMRDLVLDKMIVFRF
jgi:acyl-CoA reductase-like NAD-dependent aldehyde dehydrogenase